MFVVSEKLKALKIVLLSWNKLVFGDVNQRVDSAQKMLDSKHNQILTMGLFEALKEEEAKALSDFQQALMYQHEFWKQKSRLDWFTDGDQSMNFFYKVTKIRQASKHMNTLQSSNGLLHKQEYIESHVIDYFQALYASPNVCSRQHPSLGFISG